MNVGLAVAAAALAVVGGMSLWFARALGRGGFDLINGYKPEKVKDAHGLRRLMRVCYSVTGCGLLVSAIAMLITQALMPWLFVGIAIAVVSLSVMTMASSRLYKL